VAQGMVRKPWALEIYDFADRLHEISMEEGDIVYYESARCLHGRMHPFEGGYFVNLFVHYRPVGDPEWYKTRNPKGGVTPLIDLDTLDESNIRSLLPFLKQEVTPLQGPNSLFEYWSEINTLSKRQGPENAIPSLSLGIKEDLEEL